MVTEKIKMRKKTSS